MTLQNPVWLGLLPALALAGWRWRGLALWRPLRAGALLLAPRNLVVSKLNAAGLTTFMPGGAFYVFPDIRSTGMTSREFATRLLEEEKVAVVPGTAFGKAGEGFVRCCYATDEKNLAIALERMAAFAARHRAE